MAPVTSAATDDPVSAACQKALRFPLSRAVESGLSPSEIAEKATAEAAFGRVTVGARGLTPGMQLHCATRTRAVLADWNVARSEFDQVLAPFVPDIQAVTGLEAEISDLETRCNDEIQSRERTLESDSRYRQVKERYEIAERKFAETSMANNQRPPNTWGTHWTYWIALFCIGIAEWLINYDTFYLFTQVPAIAAGATIVMGFLLAFAAHGHGSIFKQWSHVFSLARDPRDRLREWRYFMLSTFSLVIVLAAAGGSRYAAVLRTLTAHGGPNLLGAEAEIDVNPARDVLISLLANIAAWAVGVFIAWLAHDQDPDYMGAAHERDQARKKYNRRRARADRDIESIRARFAKRVEQLKNTVSSQLRKVERQRADLAKVDTHQNGIISACQRAFQAGADLYRDTLVNLALSGKMPITFVLAENERVLTPYEYKSAPLLADEDYVRSML